MSRPYPADGSIAADDSEGQRRLTEMREIQTRRVEAAGALIKSGNLYEFENTMRTVRGDKCLGANDLHLVDTHAKDLGRLALDPLHAALPLWAEPCTEKALEAVIGKTVVHYVRQLTWPTGRDFVKAMKKHLKTYPAEAPRLTILIEEGEKLPNKVVYLRYFGTTGLSTPETRARRDQLYGPRTFFSNVVDNTGKTPEVFKLKDVESACIGFEYRERADLQATERVLVSTAFPLCGNSARGGFHHLPDLSEAHYGPRVPLPRADLATDEGDARLAQLTNAAAEYLRKERKFWETSLEHRPISNEAFRNALDASRVTHLVEGGVSHIRIAKDVPLEEFNGEEVGLGYLGKRCGPGPALSRTIVAELALGGDDDDEANPHESGERLPFGVMFDWWRWRWHRMVRLGYIQAEELMFIYQPLVVVAESREVSMSLALHDPTDLDYMGVGLSSEVDYEMVPERPYGDLEWWKCPGRVLIVPYKGPNFAILVMVGHGGMVKYDTAIGDDVTHLLVLANKAALVAVSVAAGFARTHGRPRQLAEWQALLGDINAEITSMGLANELEAGRSRLRDRPYWVQSRRMFSAAQRKVGRSATAGDPFTIPDSSSPTINIRRGTTVFVGPPGSEARFAQFERLHRRIQDLRAYGLTDTLYPNLLRPTSCQTVDDFREYHLKGREGVSVRRSVASSTAAAAHRSDTQAQAVSGLFPSATETDRRAWREQRVPGGRRNRDWTDVYSDISLRVVRQATGSKGFAMGIEVVSCETCMQTVVPKEDKKGYSESWDHCCPDRLIDEEDTDGGGPAPRDECTRTKIYFASELYRYPDLLDEVAQGSLEKHDLSELISKIRRGENGYGEFSPLVPIGFDTEKKHPPVLVAPKSSKDWIAANAVALAHSLTPGAFPELEQCRVPNTKSLQSLVRAFKGDRNDVLSLECEHPSCDFVRWNGNHNDNTPHSCVVEGPRSTSKAGTVNNGRGFNRAQDLPTHIRMALLCSRFSATNPSNVTTDMFTWRGKGFVAPRKKVRRRKVEAIESDGDEPAKPTATPQTGQKRGSAPASTSSSKKTRTDE